METVSSSQDFFSLSQFFSFLLTLLLLLMAIPVLTFILRKILGKIFFLNNLDKVLSKNNYAFLLVKIPTKNEQKENAMEDFLRALHRILPNNTRLSLEIVSQEQFLSFYLVIPKSYKNVCESQLYAQYPEAEIEETDDYLPDLEANCKVLEIKFRRSSISPVNTYRDLEEDLLKNLSAILAKTEKDEQVFIQLALKRIGSKIWERGLAGLAFQFFGKKYRIEGTPTPAYAKFSQDLYEGKLRIAYLA